MNGIYTCKNLHPFGNCSFDGLHTLGTHRIQQSADVVKNEPIEGCTQHRGVKHGTSAFGHAHGKSGNNSQNGKSKSENHHGIKEGALITR